MVEPQTTLRTFPFRFAFTLQQSWTLTGGIWKTTFCWEAACALPCWNEGSWIQIQHSKLLSSLLLELNIVEPDWRPENCFRLGGFQGLQSTHLRTQGEVLAIELAAIIRARGEEIHPWTGLLKRCILPIWNMAFSTKIKGNHHLQGNVQVYNVSIPFGVNLAFTHLVCLV